MEWISIEDRLPNDSKFVRAKTKDGTILERVAWTGVVKYWRESRTKGLDRVRRDITHWMPMETPKSKDKEEV